MKIHILPGDSLIKPFKETELEGEMIVCRECLIDGDVKASTLEDFWQIRANYLSSISEKPENFYSENVKSEFEKILTMSKKSKIYLWFEYELFCQINMWFVLFLLKEKQADIYRIAPLVKSEKEIWKGFGILNKKELGECFEAREKFSPWDLETGVNLWNAYQNQNFQKLERLSKIKSKCFPRLEAVCRAEIEKADRPKRTLERIIANGEKDFGKVFRQFNETEGIYGFGDLQVKRMYDQIVA